MNMKHHIKTTLISLFLVLSIYTLQGQGIMIGNLEWMSTNLDVTKFRNGDPIPEAKTPEEWQNARDNKQPAWCWYENDEANAKVYGVIYNWFAVNDERGLAPEGWHVATDEEWNRLTELMDGSEAAGNRLKSKEGWFENGNGSDETGFHAIPSGFRNYNGSFYVLGKGCYYWTADKNNASTAWYRFIYYSDSNVYRYNSNKGSGFSVRCVKD
jgi:uncharacterized protein (TIGR02145 family)